MSHRRSPHDRSRTRASLLAAVAILVIGPTLSGCGGSGRAGDGTEAGAEPVAEPVFSMSEPTTRTVPSGTILTLEFVDTVSSETNAAGDRFVARVVDPIVIDGETAVEAGDEVVGRVVEAIPSKKIGGKAKLGLEFETLRTASGDAAPISAVFVEEGKKQVKKDAATIGGATAGGAILGRIVGHQQDEDARGTSIGALVGAAVGTAIAATNEGDPVVVQSGTVVDVRLDAPLDVTIS